MTPSGRAHLNPRTKRCEGAESLKNAIFRLVRDMWKFGLRESLGWAVTGRLAWFPGSREPDSQPSTHLSPLIPAQPVLATGNRMAPTSALGAPLSWCPGVIVPKLSFPVPIPRRLGSRSQDEGQRRARSLGAVWGLGCGPSSLQ